MPIGSTDSSIAATRSTDNSFFIINHPSFMGNLNYRNDTIMIPFVTSFVNVIFQFCQGFPEKNAPGSQFRERPSLIRVCRPGFSTLDPSGAVAAG